MAIDKVNHMFQVNHKKTLGDAQPSPQKLSETAANFAKMLDSKPVPQTGVHSRKAHMGLLRMKHGRVFRQRMAARQSGRRRQYGKGKDNEGLDGMGSSDEGSADVAEEVSMEASAGDSNSSDAREQMTGREKKRRRKPQVDGYVLPPFIVSTTEAAGEDPSDALSGGGRHAGMDDDRGGDEKSAHDFDEDALDETGLSDVLPDWSGNPGAPADYEELAQAMAGQVDRQRFVIEQLAGEIVLAGTSIPFEKEIRLRIKDDLLEGTYIRMVIIDKTLFVDFSTRSTISYQWLKTHRHELEKYILQGMEMEEGESKDRLGRDRKLTAAKIKIVMGDEEQGKFGMSSADTDNRWRRA